MGLIREPYLFSDQEKIYEKHVKKIQRRGGGVGTKFDKPIRGMLPYNSQQISRSKAINSNDTTRI